MSKVCRLCRDKVDNIDYKDVNKLKDFMMDSGKILPRRITGLCAYHQRQVSKAIKMTRHSGLLPYVIEYYK